MSKADELAILKRVERHARRIVKGGSLETYRELARGTPGAGGKVFVSHAQVRDLLAALDCLDRYRVSIAASSEGGAS